MFVLTKEYQELDMSNLAVAVNAYMDEHNKASGETDPPPQTTVDVAPLQTTADAAPSGVEKSHGEEADPPAKAP